MQDIQPELIEKYQILLAKDPKSQIFAPLAEAYRKMGLLEEAFRIAVRGVQFHPGFGGGRVALAKIFIDRDNQAAAVEELERAVEVSPDNIMAHTLLGDCFLKSKRPKDALRSFKMVLFLAPNNEKAQKAVRKLESLTADEYEEDLFEMRRLPGPTAETVKTVKTVVETAAGLKPLPSAAEAEAVTGSLDRVLSLADAYIVRNDLERAGAVLKEGQSTHSGHPELLKRLRLVNQRQEADADSQNEDPPPSRERQRLDRKIEMLERMLASVRLISEGRSL